MRLFAFCLTASLSSPIFAHPGHGATEGNSAIHYLTEPFHIGPAVVVVAAGLTTALWLKRRRNAPQGEHVRKGR